MQFPASHSYRPALAVAFLICLLSLLLALFDLPLPSEAKGVLALFIPVAASMAILYRTALFREMRQRRRLVNLFGMAIALLICAGVLLLGFGLLAFVLGYAPPK